MDLQDNLLFNCTPKFSPTYLECISSYFGKLNVYTNSFIILNKILYISKLYFKRHIFHSDSLSSI